MTRAANWYRPEHPGRSSHGLPGAQPTTRSEHSPINWSATGQTLANSAQTSVSGGRAMSVTRGGRRTHYIVDIVGYLI